MCRKNKNFSIDIEKLPDSCDPIKIIRNAIQKKYSLCPFFNNEHTRNTLINKHWYGKQYENDKFFEWLRFWKPNGYWEKDLYECKACGGEWWTMPFPYTNTRRYKIKHEYRLLKKYYNSLQYK